MSVEAIVEPLGPEPVSAGRANGRGRIDSRTRARFVAVYTRDHPRLVAFVLRRTGDRSVAEDLAAEVFRIAWERISEAVPTSAWLFVTARNLTMAHHRASRRSAEVRQRLGAEDAVGADGSIDPRSDRVAAALDRLPAEQRELLTAYYWDDLSGAECAALAGCSVGAIWVRLHRARAALRIELDERRSER